MGFLDTAVIVGGGLAALLNIGSAVVLLSRADAAGGPVAMRGDLVPEPRLQAYVHLCLALFLATIAVGKLVPASSAADLLEVVVVVGSLAAAAGVAYVRHRRRRVGQAPR
jgi:hypothetical protein